MSDKAMCEAHAEWFGQLLKELVVPVARDFMQHGLKHGREERGKPEAAGWRTGFPPDDKVVLVARYSEGGGFSTVSLAAWDGARWLCDFDATMWYTNVVAWMPLPKWEVTP